MYRKVVPLAFILTLTLAVCHVSTALAAPAARVVVNGQQIKLDVAPTFVGGRLLVPLRAIFDALGAQVNWDDGTQTVTAVRGDITIELTIGQRIAYKNGSAVSLDVAGRVVSGRTLVPLRFIGEAFGCEVGWDDATATASVNEPGFLRPEKAGALVGLWCTNGDVPYAVDPDTGVIMDESISNAEWLEFRSDSTFRRVLLIQDEIRGGTLVTCGNYRTDGGRLVFTALTESWFPTERFVAPTPAYRSRAVPNRTLGFEFLDSNRFQLPEDSFDILGLSFFQRVISGQANPGTPGGSEAALEPGLVGKWCSAGPNVQYFVDPTTGQKRVEALRTATWFTLAADGTFKCLKVVAVDYVEQAFYEWGKYRAADGLIDFYDIKLISYMYRLMGEQVEDPRMYLEPIESDDENYVYHNLTPGTVVFCMDGEDYTFYRMTVAP
jgi:hypothetical protein